MFTSRAEYRLHLRADNADQRLTERGREIGCVKDKRWNAFSDKRGKLAAAQDMLSSLSLTPNEAQAIGIEIKLDGRRRTAFELLTYQV